MAWVVGLAVWVARGGNNVGDMCRMGGVDGVDGVGEASPLAQSKA